MNNGSLIQTHQLTQFLGRGVVRLPSILAPEEADQLFNAFRAHIGPNPETNAYGVLRNNVWRQIPIFEHTLRHSALSEVACRLLGETETVVFQDNVICKLPSTTDPVAWHQDFSYWPLDRAEGVTLWVALTDALPDNGCMYFVPGSHLLGEKSPTDFVENSNQPNQTHLPALDLADAPNPPEPFQATAGDLIAHHPLAWHMSPGNQSKRWRCAWSITFLRPSVRWSPKHAPHPFNLTEEPTEGAPLEGSLFPRFVHGLHCEQESV